MLKSRAGAISAFRIKFSYETTDGDTLTKVPYARFAAKAEKEPTTSLPITLPYVSLNNLNSASQALVYRAASNGQGLATLTDNLECGQVKDLKQRAFAEQEIDISASGHALARSFDPLVLQNDDSSTTFTSGSLRSNDSITVSGDLNTFGGSLYCPKTATYTAKDDHINVIHEKVKVDPITYKQASPIAESLQTSDSYKMTPGYYEWNTVADGATTPHYELRDYGTGYSASNTSTVTKCCPAVWLSGGDPFKPSGSGKLQANGDITILGNAPRLSQRPVIQTLSCRNNLNDKQKHNITSKGVVYEQNSKLGVGRCFSYPGLRRQRVG